MRRRPVRSYREDGRDVYVEDALFELEHDGAEQPLKEALDLAYLAGQRDAMEAAQAQLGHLTQAMASYFVRPTKGKQVTSTKYRLGHFCGTRPLLRKSRQPEKLPKHQQVIDFFGAGA